MTQQTQQEYINEIIKFGLDNGFTLEGMMADFEKVHKAHFENKMKMYDAMEKNLGQTAKEVKKYL